MMLLHACRLAALAVLALAACDDLRTKALGVYVLHDVSGSYFRELAANLRLNKAVLPQLKARDQMEIAQIVGCSFSDRAIIARADIPDRPSERNAAILGIAGALDKFGATAKQAPYTDIRGALLQAAGELQSGGAARRVIIVFSDLVEDPAPGCRRDANLPIELKGISVVAVNVAKLEADNRNPQGYFSRLESWRAYVQANGGRFIVVSDPAQLAGILRERG
jgi:hypothetical protein